ncbi:MAG: TlpA family protein disulfide reductase [Pyramidobacter sp.]|nr:TlpA family protein disulfide reductase [Pyramidobacter sp.]
MKKMFLAALAALVLMSSAACAASMGDFTIQDLDGEVHTQKLLSKAKLTMFNVWGTFCPPCLREMPDLGELAAELEPEGVQIVGLVCDWTDRKGNPSEAQIAKAKKIVAKTGASYLHLLLNDDIQQYFGDITAVPQTYFVSRSGEIVGAVTGAQSRKAWIAMIRHVLAKVE